MTREECEGCKYYDPYPCACKCTHYDEFVEEITRCEHRTVKGVRINDASNPLIMKRIPRWCEVEYNGMIRGAYHELYNPNGILVCSDGRMIDMSKKENWRFRYGIDL